MNNSTDILVTGVGAISPLGFTPDLIWEGLLSGIPCFKKISRFDSAPYYSHLAGEITDFSIGDFIRNPKYLRLPKVSQFALVSADLALKDSGINMRKTDPTRIGIFFGTSNGPSYSTQSIYNTLITKGPKSVDSLLFQETVFNASASHISIYLGIKGPTLALPMGLVSGGHAIDFALSMIKSGKIDCALVGAADEHTEVVHAGFSYLNVLAGNKGATEIVCPFDKRRNGLILSEGAGFLILETRAHFESRQPSSKAPYAQVLSNSLRSDAYNAIDLCRDGSGIAAAMTASIDRAGLTADSIDGIVGFAPSHPALDLSEAKAIQAVFKNKECPPVTSIKGVLGESMGASPLFNILTMLYIFKTGTIPGTANYQSSETEINLPIISKNTAKQCKILMTPYYYFGGLCGSLVLKKEA